MRIFLSYASEDREEAEKISLALIGAGHKVFFDKISLPPGGDYFGRIRKAIDKSDALIFLISPESIDKKSYALSELQMAEHRWPHPKNRVLPMIIKATPFPDIPVYLRAVSILEPIGDSSASLLQGLKKLRPYQNLVKIFALTFVAISVGGVVSLLAPAKSFEDPLEIPPREDSLQIEKFNEAKQLVAGGNGQLFQTPSKGVDNGYFKIVIPALSDEFAGPDVALQGGVSTKSIFHPNFYLQLQLRPAKNVNTIDLHGCGLAVVFKVRSKAMFFYSTEADASPENIPIEINYERSNTFAFRQVGSQVAVFLNDKFVGLFRAKMRPSDCSPKIFLKANPGAEAEAEFQGLFVFEYWPLNVWGRPIPFEF